MIRPVCLFEGFPPEARDIAHLAVAEGTLDVTVEREAGQPARLLIEGRLIATDSFNRLAIRR